MLASAATMVLAIYINSAVPPDTGLNPNMTIRSTEATERETAQHATPEEQRAGNGTVQDRNDRDQVNTGLYPDPAAGNAVVVPRE